MSIEERAITVWDHPTHSSSRLSETQWGSLTYQQWCVKESERMNKAGGNTSVHTREDGNIAIIRN